jgi:acetyl esterase/lipase
MWTMLKCAIYSLVLTTTVSTCNKNDRSVTEDVPQQVTRNVAYGSNAAQKMDVYLPAARSASDTKVLVFIHGGSWSGGDKSEFDQAIATLRSQLPDYAMFNINYRLSSAGNNRYPVQTNDVQRAIDFITSKAGEYMINPKKIGLIGASAGAHLALLQAYKYNTNGNVKAVVDLFGPTDLNALYSDHPFPEASRSVLVNFLGARPASNAALYQEASPLNFITAQSVPTLIFHGNLDIVNPISQSLALKAKLQAAKAKVEMITYTGEGHGWLGNNLVDTYSKVVTFIQQNVK